MESHARLLAGASPELLLLTTQEVTELLKISQVTLYRLAKAGNFPRPVRVARAVRYRACDVHDWIKRNQH